MERFYSKVLKGIHEHDCHRWQGTTTARGYGIFIIKGKQVGAHRVAWEVRNGPIPDGLVVCHKCDTPNCVNPDHLFVGTKADNNHDMIRKGRHVGRQNSKTHMSPADYVATLAIAKLTPYTASKKLGISPRQSFRYAAGTSPISFTVAKLVSALAEIEKKFNQTY